LPGPSTCYSETQVEAHIDMCPDHSLHMKVGNICLDLCRKDFLQLVCTIVRAVEHLSPADGMDEIEKDNLQCGVSL